MTTPFHAKYWAHSLLLAHPSDGVEALSRSIGNARVDLNPHQVDAALFALRSPYSRGVLLADEVGLGKTIEAALVLAQKWAERRRRILLIVPATLRHQWQLELKNKFFLPSLILETKGAKELIKRGATNPFLIDDQIVICSYQFVYAKRDLVKQVDWDLVVIDEAHRLRSIYKGTKTVEGIVEAIRPARKLLLTATPLQNSLLELYGLVSILDPELFGGQDAFLEKFITPDDPTLRDEALQERIQHVCKRTLRRQVLEYVPFTNRYTRTADFLPSAAEEQLYKEVSEYLQRDTLVALPDASRVLMTLILRKLLASSSRAIGATLGKFLARLSGKPEIKEPLEEPIDDATEDYEAEGDLNEEWEAEASDEPRRPITQQDVDAEIADLKRFIALADSVELDSKAKALVEVLPLAFGLAEGKGAAKKAVIFTESCMTQQYLFKLLTDEGYQGQIVLMNGSNDDPISKATYAEWKKRQLPRSKGDPPGSKSADMKAAIVEAFRDTGAILLATESAAEGVNLQFCSIVINYDLPWNPQRIEQRIGRCHRYGQKSDVLVVNFLNRKNAADVRVFELLDQKFELFQGVFGASDNVLGIVGSGVDLEKLIAEIYQECRTPEQITAAFDKLQLELEDKIKAGMDTARRSFLENFDAEVHERLRVHKEAAKQSLDLQQQTLLDLAKFALRERASFDPEEPRFQLHPSNEDIEQRFHLDWRCAEKLGESFFRVDHPLAHEIIQGAVVSTTPVADVRFFYEQHASALDRHLGKAGWLEVSKLSGEAVGQNAEFLLLAACDSENQALPRDVAEKLFSLRGQLLGSVQDPAPGSLATIRDELKLLRLADLSARNNSFFEEEVEKLEHWADDLKSSLESALKLIDVEIRTTRRASRACSELAEKLEAQREMRTLEQRRTLKRRELLDAEDAIDRRRAELIEKSEKQLKTKTKCDSVFTLRWQLVAPAGAEQES